MAYLRGEHYVWSDETHLHIWVADGYDNWDDTIWACDEEGKRHDDRQNASGVSISEEKMDEYVVMRLAQIIENGTITQAINRVMVTNTNVGAEALYRNADLLLRAFSGAQADQPLEETEAC